MNHAEPLDYDGLKALAVRLGRPVSTLIALAPCNDPFYIGPARQRVAQWFTELWRLGGKGVHVRRLHYRLISQAIPPLTPDGVPYENTDECWRLLNVASRDARLADLVPADHFIDRRNDEPLIHLASPFNPRCSIEVTGGPLSLYAREMAAPCLTCKFTGPQIVQRYHVELWCEKTTVNDVLAPLARRYHANVVTGSGGQSLTACVNVVDRALVSGRPVRVLYVSDFDPGGQSMPIAVARKIEHQLYTRRLKDRLDIQVRPVVLTHGQCRFYQLPRTPLKETERRGARFESRYGEGATELDALEALHLGELENILTDEIERYIDGSLDDRVDELADEVEARLAAEVEAINARVLARHETALASLREEWSRIAKTIERWEKRAKPVWQVIAEELEAETPEEPDVDWPEPDFGDEDDDPLFDSARDYVEQMDRYKSHQGKPIDRQRRENGGAE